MKIHIKIKYETVVERFQLNITIKVYLRENSIDIVFHLLNYYYFVWTDLHIHNRKYKKLSVPDRRASLLQLDLQD